MNLDLTERQQWTINVALELESMGHWIAAHALLHTHFPQIDWGDPIATTSVPWPEVFRIHNES